MIWKFLKATQPQVQELPSEIMDYEIIDISYYGRHYNPIFDMNQIEMEPYDYKDKKLHDIDEMYLGKYIAFNQNVDDYMKYLVEQEDTLFGLELKFNVSGKDILELNQLSSQELLFPGMTIKLPIKQQTFDQGQEEVLNEITQKPEKQNSFLGVNIMDEIMSHAHSIKSPVFYITDQGSVQGMLTINEDMIFFDPILNETNKSLIPDITQIMKYQASICLKDVIAVKVIDLPTRLAEKQNFSSNDYILQILLSSIGKKEFEEKYKKKLDQMRTQKKALANVYLRFVDSDTKKTREEQFMYVEGFANQINSHIQKNVLYLFFILCYKLENQKSQVQVKQSNSAEDEIVTQLPYFDLIVEADNQKGTLIQRTNKIWGGSSYIPKMIGNSDVICQDMLIQIITYMPSVFKVGDWKLLYSTTKHGSSMQTLLRIVADKSPIIMVIRDLDHYVFGSYVSDSLKLTKGHFYGSGETYLFTFKKTQDITVYKWSTFNQDIVLCDADGIAIGCGDKYGLYINSDLSEGESSPCTTFMNESLTKSGRYGVDVLEIWTMDID